MAYNVPGFILGEGTTDTLCRPFLSHKIFYVETNAFAKASGWVMWDEAVWGQEIETYRGNYVMCSWKWNCTVILFIFPFLFKLLEF